MKWVWVRIYNKYAFNINHGVVDDSFVVYNQTFNIK